MTDPRVTPSLTALADAELMPLVARRSESALVELYRRHGRRVYPLIRRIVGNDSLADEVVQDVFVRLWNRPEQYRPEGGQLAAWLTTVARNLALDALRKDRRWRDQADVDDHAYRLHTAAPEGGVEAMLAVRNCLTTLPAEQRQAVELAYFEGLSHVEVAGRLGEPLGTVKSRLRLAFEKLRASLGSARVADGVSDERV